MVKVLFWVSVALIFYTYAGYHALLKLISRVIGPRRPRSSSWRGGEDPAVSVVVAAYNEERVIEQRIGNLLGLDYPRDKVEIVIASDGSTDRTAELASRFGGEQVRVLELKRRGRAVAHNEGVAAARGEIIVFTDADVIMDPSFIRAVVDRFQGDERVGCVVGKLRWRSDGTPTGAFRAFYWKWETDLKETEGRLGILASGCGPAMAARKALWKPMSDPVDDCDSVTPLDVILQGHRVVFAEEAIAYDVPFGSARGDFKSKVRGVSKTVEMIPRRWGLRGVATHPLITWQLVSHHFLRWLCPFFLAGAMASSWFLAGEGGFYGAVVILEGLAALLLALGYAGERVKRHIKVASGFYSLAVVNAGFAVGVLKGVIGAAQGPYETE